MILQYSDFYFSFMFQQVFEEGRMKSHKDLLWCEILLQRTRLSIIFFSFVFWKRGLLVSFTL